MSGAHSNMITELASVSTIAPLMSLSLLSSLFFLVLFLFLCIIIIIQETAILSLGLRTETHYPNQYF